MVASVAARQGEIGEEFGDALIQNGAVVPQALLDLLRFSGEALGHSAASFSNCTGLVKS